jgi:hypothetical protein
VLRGGSWNNTVDNARGSQRNRNHPDNRNDNNGFRVVSSAHIPASASPGEFADHGLRNAAVGLQWRGCIPSVLFVRQERGCRACLRHVDDFALFADDKATLWRWKDAVRERLAGLRLQFHAGSAQVQPVQSGIPWLGFVVFPTHRRVKGRKVVHACRRLSERYTAWQSGEISFAEFDAGVQGWINHVRYADSWGLRRHVLQPFVF